MTKMKAFSSLSITLVSFIMMETMMVSTVLAQEEAVLAQEEEKEKVWFVISTPVTTTDIDPDSLKVQETLLVFEKTAQLEAAHYQELIGNNGERHLDYCGNGGNMVCMKCVNRGTGYWANNNACYQHCNNCPPNRYRHLGLNSNDLFTTSTGAHVFITFEEVDIFPIDPTCTELPQDEVVTTAREMAAEEGLSKYAPEIGGPIKSDLKVYICPNP